MRTPSFVLSALIVLLVLSAFSYVFYFSFRVKTQTPTINSFAECVNAGFPVAESYPRQCRADGRAFFEVVTHPLAPTAEETEIASVDTTEVVRSITDMINISTPTPSMHVTSPLQVSGNARGNWYFEASFPVTLIDASGAVLAQTPAQAAGNWMTEEFVPFTATLTWATTSATSGAVILKRDNPSGLPENDAEIRIPVVL